MPARSAFDYAVVRIVPRIEREEFVNAGVILHAPSQRFLGCAIGFDERRLRALAPDPELDVAEIARHVDALRATCEGAPDAGPIARLPPSERFHWLVAPRSTVIQTSPVHAGICDDPAAALRRLFEALVR